MMMNNMLRDFLLVGIGGALGSMARYGLTLLASYASIASEVGTFAANAIGSLLIGIIIALSKVSARSCGILWWFHHFFHILGSGAAFASIGPTHYGCSLYLCIAPCVHINDMGRYGSCR